MIRLRFASLAAGAFLSMATAVFADEAAVAQRAGVHRKNAVCTTSYSEEVPVLARIQGSAFFRTQVAITNNTNQNGVTASFQFAYTCVFAGTPPGFADKCNPLGGFEFASKTITLNALDSFVQDDFIEYLDSLGILKPGAVKGSIGTLLVTFDNLPSCNGWEANVVARTYNRLVESDANQGTVGFAYNASLFFDSADTTLVGFARDTKAAPTIAGKLRSNIGIRNTDINGSNQNMTVDISFYDTATGAKVGSTITFADLRPGEVRQLSDAWVTAGISSAVTSVIVFADARNPTLTSPTMEGYIVILDGQNTQDGSLFTLLCADANGCGN